MSIHLHPDELIFHKVGDEIISAGFGINSVLLNRGLPTMLSFANGDVSSSDDDGSSSSSSDEENDTKNKSVFKSFKNLAVPLGLFTSDKYKQHGRTTEPKYKGTVSDELYDKLLNLVDNDAPPAPPKKQSKKYKPKQYNNKSKRNKSKK